MSPSSKTKKRSSKRKTKSKICKTCNQDILANEKRDMYMFKDTYHQLMAKEYCKEQILKYDHKNCKPEWCDECQNLTGYLVNY